MSCFSCYTNLEKGMDMKLYRLIGILSILLQRETVTAPYLAEKFEVSRRTISRDIETLCSAGIPIVTRQGVHGGISIMEGYRIDRTLLSAKEMQDVLAGLRSLDSVHGTNQYGQLMEKLSAGSSDFMTGNQSILIDLSAWNRDSLAPKISMIRSAIDAACKLSFFYYSPRGEQQRTAEPYYLIFRWSGWYLWAYCETRKDFRLFKLGRMTGLKSLSQVFERRAAPLPDLRNERIFPGGIRVKALFDSSCKWRLVEEFGEECFQVQEDGKLLFEADYTSGENLITWMMTFGERAILLEPEELRQDLQKRLRSTLQQYEERNKI